MAKKGKSGKGASAFERRSIIYFNKPGKQNTKKCLDIAFNRAKKLGITNILVPSTTGKSGAEAVKRFKSLKGQIVVVTHHFGFKEKGKWQMEEKYTEDIVKNGGCIFTSSHALSGVERSFRNRFGGISMVEAASYTIRGLLGQGIKVCVEIAIMCADAGFAPVDTDVIALGGTDTGLDTVVVMRPSHMNTFFDIKIKEILAIPKR